MKEYSSINIKDSVIGSEEKAFIIAEIAQAHDGSLGMAHAYIDAVADAGADAIKFQTHIASEESTLDEPFRVAFSYQDETRYDYWKRMEFTEAQWYELAKHAEERGLVFLSSAFSVAAVNLLLKIGVPAWKIGSGEINSSDLIKVMINTGMPILLSTGMSDWEEITKNVSLFQTNKVPFALFQCTTRYPTSLEQVGLNLIDEFRKDFKCPVGLSDHSGSIYPSLAAMARNTDLLELHVTFDRRMFGPDVKASITVDELKSLVEANNAFYTMKKNPVNKDCIAEELQQTKSLFTKSIALKETLSSGTVLKAEHLTFKKPGTGYAPDQLVNLIGKRLVRDVAHSRLLCEEDMEQ